MLSLLFMACDSTEGIKICKGTSYVDDASRD